jgi:hypothetical protein
MRKYLVALAAYGSIAEPLSCFAASVVLLAICIVQVARGTSLWVGTTGNNAD